uniref:C2 domain-containing protein n=1 Tax=Amphiprion ocellaris TaxID=80972 RepID=A0A3Q1CWA7_AMPOC
MAAPQKFIVRVYVATDVAMKLTLNERPVSRRDPDFDGQLSVLVDIEESPEKGTLKEIRSESDDTSAGMEHVLEEGNSAFEMSGKTLKLTRSQKHNILENMAETMHSFKPYPNDREVGKAAEALVTAHPCLRELGSDSGWYGWKVSLKFQMGNYRTKLVRSGCAEVSVNTGRRSKNNPEREQPHSNIKRARRFEVSFLPNFRRGENQVFAEFHRITNVNLRSQFYSELDRHTPRLISISVQGSSDCLLDTTIPDLAKSLTSVLVALPLDKELDICYIPVALITIGDIFSPQNILVVVEGEVLAELPRFPDAFMLFFGLIYTFNLHYPKKLLNMFTFVQEIVMCLDDSTPLKPHLQSLKNDLLHC